MDGAVLVQTCIFRQMGERELPVGGVRRTTCSSFGHRRNIAQRLHPVGHHTLWPCQMRGHLLRRVTGQRQRRHGRVRAGAPLFCPCARASAGSGWAMAEPLYHRPSPGTRGDASSEKRTIQQGVWMTRPVAFVQSDERLPPGRLPQCPSIVGQCCPCARVTGRKPGWAPTRAGSPQMNRAPGARGQSVVGSARAGAG
jgi:hypothetical protein